MQWQILSNQKVKNTEDITSILLENRNIKDAGEFFKPTKPENLTLTSLGLNKKEIDKSIQRINVAKENNELVFIYGDYDADGICATAILWETLHSIGINVLPHIPDRFEEGYGINPASIKKIKSKHSNLSLIITVDNGIVANEGIECANELGIEVIVLDHHAKGQKIPNAHAIVHTTLLSGSGIAWFFAQHILGSKNKNTLELAAIGTIADQIPLIGPNRSLVKYGLEELNITSRPGLKAMFENSSLTVAGMLIKPLSIYEIGYVIAPRLNAMGRLKHGIESLRLLCTKDRRRAVEIASVVSATNIERQTIVEEVVALARVESTVSTDNILIIAGEKYHEGVIGLAAGRLVEEFNKPAIVISVKGEIAKASARSVDGFNIIEAIRSLESLYIEGGGHPMAAGFSIATKNIDKFKLAINKYASKLLVGELTQKKVKIDLEIGFDLITQSLNVELIKFEPLGIGNLPPTFVAKNIEVVNTKKVGKTLNHIKLTLKQNEKVFDSIYFGGAKIYPVLDTNKKVDCVFQIEENVWNGHTSLQLKIKDLKTV